MPPKAKNLQQQISDVKLKLAQLEEDYVTALYFETMPEYDPLYKYCYSTSCNTIPYPLQSVDAWVRAVIKHMSLRKRGKGGETTKALVITIPILNRKQSIENWLEFTTKRLRKRVTPRKLES